MKTNSTPDMLEAVEYDEQTAALRVGRRIRQIRSERGMSQAELGECVGLTADRIQKYENGARKPKIDLLKKIAAALGVSASALSDPNVSTAEGAMQALFDLEELFGLQIEKVSENDRGEYRFTVAEDSELLGRLKQWYCKYKYIQEGLISAVTAEEKQDLLKEYHDWKWNYPRSLTDVNKTNEQKSRILRRIEELQEVYKLLDDAGNN